MSTLLKYSYQALSITFLVAILLGVVSYNIGSQLFNKEVQIISSQYVTDLFDDKKLVWASHNIIVGRVITQSWTISINGLPASIFTVEVINNIKGYLTGSIQIAQEGWCINGECYLSEGDIIGSVPSISDISSYLLQIGTVYVLTLRGDSNNIFMLSSHPAGKSIIQNTKKIVEFPRYKTLLKAYTEEETLEADIMSNNARNAFSKLWLQEKNLLLKSLQ